MHVYIYTFMYACITVCIRPCTVFTCFKCMYVCMYVCIYMQGSQVSLFCDVYVGAVCRKSNTQLLALQAHVSDVLGLVTHTYIHTYIHIYMHS